MTLLLLKLMELFKIQKIKYLKNGTSCFHKIKKISNYVSETTFLEVYHFSAEETLKRALQKHFLKFSQRKLHFKGLKRDLNWAHFWARK